MSLLEKIFEKISWSWENTEFQEASRLGKIFYCAFACIRLLLISGAFILLIIHNINDPVGCYPGWKAEQRIKAEKQLQKKQNILTMCNDGWVSQSSGQGTCSHHGGVNYSFVEP